MKKPNQLNVRFILDDLRDDSRYQRYELAGEHENPDYEYTYMRDVEDSVGTKYVIVMDVFKTMTGPQLCPHVQFNDGRDTVLEIEEPKSLRSIETFFDRMWHSLEKPRDNMLLN